MIIESNRPVNLPIIDVEAAYTSMKRMIVETRIKLSSLALLNARV